MKRLILLCFFLVCFFPDTSFSQKKQTRKNVLEHGLSQNELDQSHELGKLLANDTHLFFPTGQYHFTRIIKTGSLKNFTIEGETGTEFITDQPILLEVTGEFKNVFFKKISIRSTDETLSSGGQLSLVHCNEQNVTDFVLEDVFMTAPKSATNGLKFINEKHTKTQGVVLRRFKVDSIGRMGFEIQNHRRQSGNNEVARYEDILVEDSEFNHTGLREYGMGVSVGGLGKKVRIFNSDFTGSPNRAIEFIGTEGVEINGNCFEDNFASIVITRNKIVTGQPTKNVTISNNVIDKSEEEGFINIEDLTMKYNIFRIQGRLKFENVKMAKIVALTIDTDAYAAMTVAGLNDFSIESSHIKNRRAGNNLIRIEGESNGFKIMNTNLYPGKGQWAYDDVEGTNSFPIFKNVKVYDSKGVLVETLTSDK